MIILIIMCTWCVHVLQLSIDLFVIQVIELLIVFPFVLRPPFQETCVYLPHTAFNESFGVVFDSTFMYTTTFVGAYTNLCLYSIFVYSLPVYSYACIHL